MNVSQKSSTRLISLKDAISNLNPDEDEQQIDIKVEQAKADADNKTLGNNPFNESNYFGDVNNDNEGTEPTGIGNRRSTGAN